jgi:hypothetical protein
LLDPVPKVVDVARLPHNPEKVTQEGLIPGFKIEFEDEQTRRLVLSKAKNLGSGSYAPLSVRKSMSEGERSSISAFRQMTAVLARQGIQNLPIMMPSGNIKRSNYGYQPQGGMGYGQPMQGGMGYGQPMQGGMGYGQPMQGGMGPGATYAAAASMGPVGPVGPDTSQPATSQPAATAQDPAALMPQRVNNFFGGRQRRAPLNVMDIQ